MTPGPAQTGPGAGPAARPNPSAAHRAASNAAIQIDRLWIAALRTKSISRAYRTSLLVPLRPWRRHGCRLRRSRFANVGFADASLTPGDSRKRPCSPAARVEQMIAADLLSASASNRSHGQVGLLDQVEVLLGQQ